jgi:hypothetical protein
MVLVDTTPPSDTRNRASASVSQILKRERPGYEWGPRLGSRRIK